jgi:dienelactone hydrolase
MNGASTTDLNPSNVKGICPDGWHLPSDAEWIELEMFLGMSFEQADAFGWRGTDEGDKMKANFGWNNNGNGNNSSGFSALPAGSRLGGTFDGLGETTRYWSTTELADGQGPGEDITLLVARSARPLVPGARYALVVTRGLRDALGAAVVPDAGFAAPAELDCLRVAPSPLCPSDIATAAVFTTSAVTEALAETREWLGNREATSLNLQVDAPVPPATLAIWPDTVTAFPASSVVIRGAFDAPDLRDLAGDMPRAAGEPFAVQGTLRIPFLLLLPSDAVPGPWPVVVLAHGKNGSKERLAYLAQRFGEAGIALAAIDAVGHGALAGLGNFDTIDVPTLRGSYLQSQVDLLVFFRVLQQMTTPNLDVSRGIGFIGESMGGILGGVTCAAEPAVRGAVLNVAGGGLAGVLLSYAKEFIAPEQVLILQSLEALVQPLLEPADPLAFAALMQAPSANRSVLLQAAVGDDTVPNATTDALARALDLTQVCPCVLDVPGLPHVSAPASVDGLHYFADAAHGFLLKNDSNPDASDAARRQAATFLGTALAGEQGQVVVPEPAGR